MPGFLINNYGSKLILDEHNGNGCIVDSCQFASYYVQRSTIPKFLKDKTLFEDGKYIIVLEGVLLNKLDLFGKYQIKVKDVSCLVIAMYERLGEKFFDEFRGSFSGTLYDKSIEKWIIFTNHYGDNAVYYYLGQNKFVVGSQLRYITAVLQENKIEYSLNEDAIHSMLTYGYMSNDMTYMKEIKRLLPGHYMTVQKGKFNIFQYFRIRQDVYDLKNVSEEEIIDGLDKRFRNAVRLEYEKDLEYGYRHLAQLSGGLDSRMNLWVARDMGYKDILCMTYCQSGYTDEKVAKQIAKELGLEILVWPLDGAQHMLRIDDYIALNGGAAIYSALGAGIEILQSLNQTMFGLLHTGQIGDVVIGTFISNKKQMEDMSIGGAYSEKLISKKDEKSSRRFNNREEYLIFIRGFMGCLSSHFLIRNYTEVSSPFLNVDLFEYCLSIPIEMRIKHYIYKKWILSKYPKAADFVWEKINRKITEMPFKTFFKYGKIVIRNPKLLLRKLGFPVRISEKLMYGMNPLDLWWKENKKLREVYEKYFQEKIDSLFLSESIKEELKTLWTEGCTSEKTQVITALGVVESFFGN